MPRAMRRSVSQLAANCQISSDAHSFTCAARALPTVPRDALAGIGPGDIGELAFEARGERESVAPFHLGRSGGECGIMRLRRAVDDKGGARQRLEGRGDIAVGM